MADKPVYSTAQGGGDLRKKGDATAKPQLAKGSGPMKMRLETKGRGGKAVTVLFNLPMDEAAAVSLMKELQGHLGTGATFKDGTIEIRGDMRDRVEQALVKRGMKVVRAGG